MKYLGRIKEDRGIQYTKLSDIDNKDTAEALILTKYLGTIREGWGIQDTKLSDIDNKDCAEALVLLPFEMN